jgi:hypothetical protein
MSLKETKNNQANSSHRQQEKRDISIFQKRKQQEESQIKNDYFNHKPSIAVYQNYSGDFF